MMMGLIQGNMAMEATLLQGININNNEIEKQLQRCDEEIR